IDGEPARGPAPLPFVLSTPALALGSTRAGEPADRSAVSLRHRHEHEDAGSAVEAAAAGDQSLAADGVGLLDDPAGTARIEQVVQVAHHAVAVQERAAVRPADDLALVV